MHCAVVAGHADERRVLVEIDADKDRADGRDDNNKMTSSQELSYKLIKPLRSTRGTRYKQDVI